jgi:copper chaperone
MKSQTITVQGMSCGHCVKRVEQAARALAGVDQASVDLNAKRLSVTFNEATISAEAIVAAVSAAGYPAKAD